MDDIDMGPGSCQPKVTMPLPRSDDTVSEVGSDISIATPSSEEKNDCTVKFRIDAEDIFGSASSSFRDAQVTFSEDRLKIRAIASGQPAENWTLFSDKLPGRICIEESRFNLSKTGKWLSMTLQKASREDDWSEWSGSFTSYEGDSSDMISGECTDKKCEGNPPAFTLGQAFL